MIEREVTWNWNPKRWAFQSYESLGGQLRMRWIGPLLVSWIDMNAKKVS